MNYPMDEAIYKTDGAL